MVNKLTDESTYIGCEELEGAVAPVPIAVLDYQSLVEADKSNTSSRPPSERTRQK